MGFTYTGMGFFCFFPGIRGFLVVARVVFEISVNPVRYFLWVVVGVGPVPNFNLYWLSFTMNTNGHNLSNLVLT
jgi:hypothetical protein